MSANKKTTTKNTPTATTPKIVASNAPKQTVEVMYQNLNGVWYAFANMGEHIFVGKVPQKAPKDGNISQIKMVPFEASDFDTV